MLSVQLSTTSLQEKARNVCTQHEDDEETLGKTKTDFLHTNDSTSTSSIQHKYLKSKMRITKAKIISAFTSYLFTQGSEAKVGQLLNIEDEKYRELSAAEPAYWSALGSTPAPTTFGYPENRFVAFDYLDKDTYYAAQALGYSDAQIWNTPGTADVERRSWWNLTQNEMLESKIIGFGEETWDCYVSHYSDYDWSELEQYGLQAAFRVLGWTEEVWTYPTEANLPLTETLLWNQLSCEEQKAAAYLCFGPCLWDSVSLDQWNEETCWDFSEDCYES